MINKTEILKLQKLAKISFSEDELDNFVKKLNKVVDMIDTLQDINCENIEPLRSVSDMEQRMIEDKVVTGDISEQLFTNVPKCNSELAKEVKCFVVPKVVE